MNSMCIQALELAEKAYPKKKLQHAIRVANYAVEIAELDSRCETMTYLNTDYVFTVAILHDLVEDTWVSQFMIDEQFDEHISDAVTLLTKPEDVEYKDYIDNLVKSGDILAYWVKKADMKDHMAQTDTLTEKLVNKYAPVLHYFI